jgi:hypothetical protein
VKARAHQNIEIILDPVGIHIVKRFTQAFISHQIEQFRSERNNLGGIQPPLELLYPLLDRRRQLGYDRKALSSSSPVSRPAGVDDGKPLPPEAEDVLLTAEDVTGLDLLDTELVVLSACDTELGEVHTGEGVFGLRRAFIVAGARTLVMSLWQVPAEQTRELMIDFHQRVLPGREWLKRRARPSWR